MKSITVVFEDEEHKKLVGKKGEKTWHNFILELIK
jgi:predicted CopG family antitoxin